MKYTQDQLEAMSDDLINAIATHIHDKLNETWEIECNGVIVNNPQSQRNWVNYDVKLFCKEWSACELLIDALGSKIEFDCNTEGEVRAQWWNAFFLYKLIVKHNLNTKRAITIIYILINQLNSPAGINNAKL